MENKILWTSGFFNERFPAPISPLGWSLLGPLIEEIALREPLRYLGYPAAATIPLTRLWRGHPYANVRAFQIFYKVFPGFLLPEDAFRYFPNGDASSRKQAGYPRSIFSPRFLFSMLRAFWRDPQNFSSFHNYRKWQSYTREHDARVAAVCARLDALAQAEPRALFAALNEAEFIHRDFLRIHRWSLMHADLTLGILKRLARAWISRERADEMVARLVAGVPNKTLQVDAALRRGARGEGRVASDVLELFLREHGHRSFSLDIATPTFAEEPEQVARLMHATKDERQKTEDENLSSVVRLPSGIKGAIFNRVLSLARKYVGLREDQRYYWQKSLAVSRRLYLLLADRLIADAVIAERDAVFYAAHQELADYFDGRVTQDEIARGIAARRDEWRAYEREFAESPDVSYPAFLQGDVPFVENADASVSYHAAKQWRGRAVSPGIARGVARVVHSANELSRVHRGEILVAPATDPAWTLVFARLAGLVVERGGVLSHSAVVAREYRVPAVAGIAGIVAAIRDGEMIEVDGNAGTVKRVGAG